MKKQLELSNDLAKDLLGKNAALDALIKSNFTDTELGLSITDRIKTFADVLAYNGETEKGFAERTQFDTPDEKAYKVIKAIALALNEGESLRYDGSTWRYYPWFRVTSGFGFSYYDWTDSYTGTRVGSRLCFKTKELAEYAGRTFTKEYEALINPTV